jgi:hypothetical protein
MMYIPRESRLDCLDYAMLVVIIIIVILLSQLPVPLLR